MSKRKCRGFNNDFHRVGNSYFHGKTYGPGSEMDMFEVYENAYQVKKERQESNCKKNIYWVGSDGEVYVD